MLTSIDHVIFAVLAVLFPLWAAVFGMRRLQRASPADLPRARLWLYRRAILIQWTLALAVSLHWFSRGRSATHLGLGTQLSWGLIGVALGLAIVVVMMLRQRAEALADHEALARVRERLRRLEILMPRTREELGWFIALSITAGLCEELLYRGYLVWYLEHWLALIPAVVVAAVLFGVGHAYQGPRGILVTAVVGLFLGMVYAITGSLFAGMVIHALMDVHSGHLGYVALTRAPGPGDGAFAADPAAESVPDMDSAAVETFGSREPEHVDDSAPALHPDAQGR